MKQLHFNRKKLLRAIYLACIAMALSFNPSAKAQSVVPTSVTAPYSVDLTNGGSFTTTGSALSPGDSATWAPSASGFQGTVVSSGFHVTTTAASTIVSNLGTTPTNFVESADISTSSFSGYQSGSIGMYALGNGTTASAYSPGAMGYAVGMSVGGNIIGTPGVISIGALAGGAPIAVSGATPLTFTVGDVYHFELQGVYGAGNDLTLTLTVTDLNNPSNTESLTADVGVAQMGQNFGAQLGAVASGYTGTVSNFSVDFATVPEPSDFALIVLGGVALLGVARRQRKMTV